MFKHGIFHIPGCQYCVPKMRHLTFRPRPSHLSPPPLLEIFVVRQLVRAQTKTRDVLRVRWFRLQTLTKALYLKKSRKKKKKKERKNPKRNFMFILDDIWYLTDLQDQYALTVARPSKSNVVTVCQSTHSYSIIKIRWWLPMRRSHLAEGRLRKFSKGKLTG